MKKHISRFTKVNQFADILPLDLAQLCLSYEEYPRLNPLDIAASAEGYWKKIARDDKIPWTESLIFHQSDMPSEYEEIEDLLSAIEREIKQTFFYNFNRRSPTEGILLRTYYGKDRRSYDTIYNWNNWSKYDDIVKTSRFNIKNVLKLNGVVDMYRFILISFMASNGLTNIRQFLKPTDLNNFLYGEVSINTSNDMLNHIPESIKTELYNQIFKANRQTKNYQKYERIYYRDFSSEKGFYNLRYPKYTIREFPVIKMIE